MRITKKQSNNEGDGDLKILPGTEQLKGRFTWNSLPRTVLPAVIEGFKQQAQGS